MKVLVVEAPGSRLESHARAIASSGLSVELAEDDRAALWLLDGGGYRAVVLDMRRGGRPWDVVAAALQQRPPARVILLADAPVEPALRRRAYGAGVWELLEIPPASPSRFLPELLTAVVRRALGVKAPPSILFVDDCADVADGIGALVADLGCRVERAASSAQALRLMQSGTYALIVTETRRIGPDGFQVMREASRLQPGVPVVVLSAEIDDVTFMRSIELGAAACLWKLAEPDDIVREIQAALTATRASGAGTACEEI